MAGHWNSAGLARGIPRWLNPVRSLPARISLSVFGATLITSLVVTAISMRSLDHFLRDRVEQTLPALLERTDRQLGLFYDQRLLEIGVFASSGILSDNIPLLDPGARSSRERGARREVSRYLRYVLESFPQYEALFVLGANGEELVRVGAEAGAEVRAHDALPAGVRSQLARVSQPSLSDATERGDGLIQLASAPVGDDNNSAASLHAVIALDSLGGILQLGLGAAASAGLGGSPEIFVLDGSGRYLLASSERLERQSWLADSDLARLLGEAGPVIQYFDHGGERALGSVRSLPRFGWLLAVEQPYEEAFAPVVSGTRKILAVNLAIVLFFALFAFRIARSIVRPIEALSRAARRISEGEKDVALPNSETRDEVGVLTRTFNEMTSRLASNARELEASHVVTEQAIDRMRRQNEELQRVNEILEQLSITDGLTTLHNHRYFQEYLTKETKRAGRTGTPLALVLIDIDHFKNWNDRLGHSAGDEILRRIAEIMQALTRETDLLARYGGEEFALVLPNTELEGAVRLAEKIRQTIAETRFFMDPPSERQTLTVSMGVSIYYGDKRAFFDHADQALYRAKAAGRDCVMLAEDLEDGT